MGALKTSWDQVPGRKKASPVEWPHLPCDHCQDHSKNGRNRSQSGLISQKIIENYKYNMIVISSMNLD